MKKTLYISMTIVIALLAAISFTACNLFNKAEQSNENDEINLDIEDDVSNLTNISSENVGSPSELSGAEVVYVYLEKQKGFTGYKMSTVGTTKAKKAFITYEQKANNTTYKSGNEYFQECTSNSTFVNMTHQAFVKGDKVAYRNASSGQITVASKLEYKKTYGISPDDKALGGYIINSKTLKSVEKTQEKNGLYTYRLSLDVKLASANLVKQMKEFGGLNGYPNVHTLTLYLTIKGDWTPTKLVVESTYDISIAVLGDMSCTHNFTTDFSLVNNVSSIPNVNDFRNKLGG